MRQFPSWVEAFHSYTEVFPSPSIFRKWAGISIIAGALERKVWVRSLGSNLYPNLYVVLVGPPGVGKSAMTSRAWSMWKSLSSHHVASSSVTKAALIDELSEATRTFISPTGKIFPEFNSLLVASNELGVLIPGYENDFMNTLTDLWDCHPFGERRRTSKSNIQMEAPQLNLLAGTTPSYLGSVMPEGAWDQGFISRVILVYSGEASLQPLFSHVEAEENVRKKLEADLEHIGNLHGLMTFTSEAAELITNWHLAKGPPQPDHPRLASYKVRRTAHLLKLCMVASACRSDRLDITIEDFQTALDWLLEAEEFMPDIFKAMKGGGDGKAIEAVWYFAYEQYVKRKEPITEHAIILFLQERVPAHSVDRVLSVMVRGGLLEQGISSKGQKTYKPMAKKATG